MPFASTSIVARARSASRDVLRRLGVKIKQRAKLPPSPFLDWEFEDADEAVAAAVQAQTIDTSRQNRANQPQLMPADGEAVVPAPRGLQDPLDINRAFYQGDHWQNSGGYIGPHPSPSDPGAAIAWNEIALTFTSKNAIREVSDRHALGVSGKPVRWSFVVRRDLAEGEEPNDAEQTLIKEATAIVRNWLKARKAHSLLRDAIVTLLLSERSALQLIVPGGLTETSADGQAVVLADSIEEGISKVYLRHPLPQHSVVSIDDDTQLECGIWLFDAEGDDGRADDFAGIVFLDQQAQTITRIMSKRGAPAESSLDLGGRLTMFEMHRAALITSSVQQEQRVLNLARTMIPRNLITGGFLERLLLDAQLPGRPEVDANGKKTGKWIREPFYTGAGTTNFVAAAEHEDDEGKITVGSPSVVFRDPVPPDASIKGADDSYRTILDQVSQLHVLLSGDSDPSGKSRIEARAEYIKSLLLTQPEAESAWAWMCETALAYGEALARTPGKYTKFLRADAQCRLDAGPLSVEEITAIQERIGKTLSQETAMALLGIDDIEGEKAKMQSDIFSRAAFAKVIGEALMSLTTGSEVSLEGAVEFLGIDGKQKAALLKPATFSNEPPTPIRDTARQIGSGGNPGNPNPERQGGGGGRNELPARQQSASGTAA